MDLITGIIVKKVKNKAKEIKTVLGGVCCKPKALRNMERTTTILVKEDNIIKKLGAKLSKVSKAKTWRAGEIEPASTLIAPNEKVEEDAIDATGKAIKISNNNRG